MCGPPASGWHPFEFLPGDLLILLTDGIAEVMDRTGNELGLDPLEATVLQDPGAPLPALYERIGLAARNHRPQVDDQTMHLARRVGGELPGSARSARRAIA